MLTAGTPETANPVCDACELNEVPCVSSVVPWQPWFFGRKGDPAKGFDWTYHFFWGLEDVIANFTNGWNSVADQQEGRRPVPERRRRQRLGRPEPRLSQAADGHGLHAHRPRPLPERHPGLLGADRGLQDATACEIVTGVVIPPDAKTFLTQARQQGFRPKVHHARQGAAVSRARSRRSAISATASPPRSGGARRIRSRRRSPKQSASALADGLREPARRSSGRSRSASRTRCSRSRPTRSSAARARRAKDVRDAVVATNLQTVVGPVKWGGQGPFKNVSKTPLVLGQWGKGRALQDGADDRQRPGRAGHPRGRQDAPDGLTAGLKRPCPRPCSRCARSASLWGAPRHRRHLARGSRGRDARHPRPQRRGQDDALQPVSGDVRCDQGSVHYDGRDVTQLKPHQRCRLGIGRSYQVPQPFGHMTVFENLVTAACFGGGQAEHEAWETAAAVLEQTGLLAHANKLGRRAHAPQPQAPRAGARARARGPSCCCSTRSPAASPTTRRRPWSRS